ncbi:MAG: TolB family protein, partial [Phycisphaeraceae bacterium]|nr:TolB family protein [Phycisphaeraceae bacterium]
MTHSRLTTAILTAGLLMASAGCQQYNGATQLDGGNSTVESRYRQFMLDQERQRQAQAALEAGQPTPVQTSPNDRFVRFNEPAKPDSSTTPAPATEQAVAPTAATPIVPASNRRDPSMAQFGLYGQLPDAGPQRRGPLDGPDNLRQISFASTGADMDPAVDPTGNWIVFASTRHRQTPDIYLQKIDGTAVQQLTNDAASDRMPSFSPDGKRIAFASNRAGNWDIFLTDPDGGQPIQLTSDPTQDIHPSFSPDGKKLVYCSYGSESGQWEMVVID